MSLNLVGRFGRVAEILVWRGAGNQITEIILGKGRNAIDVFLFFIGHIIGHLADFVNGGIIKGQWIGAKGLELRLGNCWWGLVCIRGAIRIRRFWTRDWRL